MGKAISFSEFDDYLSCQKERGSFIPGAILDTNVLITISYDIKDPEDEIINFLDKSLVANGISFFSTVNTKFEYLEFFRRLLMTEYLRDAIDPFSKIKIPKHVRSLIQTISGRLSQREKRGGDPVFTDRELKEIKKAFSAGRHSGFAGWLEHCEAALAGKLRDAERELALLGVTYISPHETSQEKYFHQKLEWRNAIQLSEDTCLGFSDAMIINILQCSRFSFMVSLDFDTGYAAHSSDKNKDVVMPDSMIGQYRNLHFYGT